MASIRGNIKKRFTKNVHRAPPHEESNFQFRVILMGNSYKYEKSIFHQAKPLHVQPLTYNHYEIWHLFSFHNLGDH